MLTVGRDQTVDVCGSGAPTGDVLDYSIVDHVFSKGAIGLIWVGDVNSSQVVGFLSGGLCE